MATTDSRSKFKIAQAAKTRAAKSQPQTPRVSNLLSDADIQAAKRTDPSNYLQSQGFDVKRVGNGYEAKRGGVKYNIGRAQNGNWVSFGSNNSNGAGNIELVDHIEPGTNFRDAVSRFVSISSNATNRQQISPVRAQSTIFEPTHLIPPILVSGDLDDRFHGRNYLMARGIDPKIIYEAEELNLLSYKKGFVRFLGYDEKGEIQSITNRATFANATINKWDEENSHKHFTPIYHGDPNVIWVVEGGISAMALLAIHDRHDKKRPTVLVSGGSGNRAFVDEPVRQALFKNAQRVFVASEIESAETPEKTIIKQAEQDAKREMTRVKIAKITNADVLPWFPKHDADLAELNLREINQEKLAALQTNQQIIKSYSPTIGS